MFTVIGFLSNVSHSKFKVQNYSKLNMIHVTWSWYSWCDQVINRFYNHLKMVKLNMDNKVNFLQSAGFLEVTFDPETLRFKRSWRRWLQSNLVFLLDQTAFFKICISSLFERESPLQLLIGSVFNAFEGAARFLMADIVSMRRASTRNFHWISVTERLFNWIS